MTTREQILAAVKRPNGLSIASISGDGKAISGVLCRLIKNGLVFRAKLGHRTMRYFDTAAKAAAYTSKTAPPAPRRGPRKVREGWGPTDPCVITAETKVTIAPTPQRSLRTNTHSPW